ncbi:hypothetical protein BU23DRAFT_651930 [Bimuria novae-zelandiae CBS 107.79]|uniref:Uncharacterized protein n=1 Tax=Bimuria novae-zelandiae CBS 107.79 TaxID=1447943 RepID=A0A6A5V8T9_9PLEO|nr:hypothetical protein BU23DRAFT_651930 [Bimuria novae-zelandiae CBS 107.79]
MPVFSKLCWPFNHSAPAVGTFTDSARPTGDHAQTHMGGTANMTDPAASTSTDFEALARDNQPRVYTANTTSAHLPEGPPDMEYTYGKHGFGGDGADDVVESIEKDTEDDGGAGVAEQEQDMYAVDEAMKDAKEEHTVQHDQAVTAVMDGEHRADSAAANLAVADTAAQEKIPVELTTTESGTAMDGHDSEMARTAPRSEPVEEHTQSQTKDQSIEPMHTDANRTDMPEVATGCQIDVQEIVHERADQLVVDHNTKSTKEEQIAASDRGQELTPSSPLPIRDQDVGEEELEPPEDEPSEPSSDTAFMQQIGARLGFRIPADRGHSSRPAETTGPFANKIEKFKPTNQIKGFQSGFKQSKHSQDVHPHMARSSNFPNSLRDASVRYSKEINSIKKPATSRDSQLFQYHSARLENVRGGRASHGPYAHPPWNPNLPREHYAFPQAGPGSYPPPDHGEAPPYAPTGSNSYTQYPMQLPPSPPPLEPFGFQGAFGMQSPEPEYLQGDSDHSYGATPSPPARDQHVSAHPKYDYHKSGPSTAKATPHVQLPTKRKAEENLDDVSKEEDVRMLDYDEPSDTEDVKVVQEDPDDYEPSSEDDESEYSSDDEPLMTRGRPHDGSVERKRPVVQSGGESQSEYEDEEGQEPNDEDDEEEEGNGAQELSQVKEEDQDDHHIAFTNRSPTAPAQGPSTSAPQLFVKLPLPKARSHESSHAPAGPYALPRSLPVLQSLVAPPPTSPDEISFKLPAYNVELMPLENSEDAPEVKVSLPGMPREILFLTVDHARQEIHLLENLFLPNQQALAVADPPDQARYALLNFHTVATMVLEAYAVHEEGDVVAEPVGKDGKKVEVTQEDVRQATIDEIFFAVMDRWRVGLAEDSIKPAYKLIRGVQEFCDIALDVIYYLEEYGFVEGELMVKKERRDRGVKKAFEEKAKAKAGAKKGKGKEEEESEEGTPKKRGRPPKSESGESPKGRGKANTLTSRKKPKTEKEKKGPAAASKKKGSAKPSISVVKKGKGA